MHQRAISLERRIRAFAVLGKVMRDAAAGIRESRTITFFDLIFSLETINPWFTPENVRRALRAIGENLNEENLRRWLERYPDLSLMDEPATVGVVMAGNIPLVGFHDLLCVLITGNRLIARLSSKDEPLMRAVTETLISHEPAMREFVSLTTENLSGFEKVIATGSDNTARYFEYYFRDYPSIIRKNRNSVAVVDGTETDEELRLLGDDIFAFFGLGCRSVSKLYLHEGYDLVTMTAQWQRYEKLRRHYKYAVNYDHNKAVMLVNRQQFTDTGFILLRHDTSLAPPMAVVNYEFYPSVDWLKKELESGRSAVQCVTGHGYVPFGKAQQPELWDYADDVDTIQFLLKKNTPL